MLKAKTRPRFRLRNKANGDISLLIIALAYSAFGVLMVYSASRYNAAVQYGDEFYFVKKQLIGYALGAAGMLAAGAIDYKKLMSRPWIKWVALVLSCALLALVFAPGIGKSNYGATRWIALGPVTVQPSELAKYGFVIFAASWIASHPQGVKYFRGILPVLLSGGLICALIIAEPNMSVTMCVALVMLGMIFLSGTRMRNVAAIGLPLAAAVPAMIIAKPYRMQRLLAFINPWASPKEEGYQLIQSLYALGNGGLFGVGLFNSRQKYRFLTFAESDFILSVIGEELGFAGVLAVFAVAVVIIYKGIKIASACDELFGYMLSVGITLTYAVQTAINALVVSGSIPPTGLPLPFISSGNTSLIFSMTAMGLLYSVSRSRGVKSPLF